MHLASQLPMTFRSTRMAMDIPRGKEVARKKLIKRIVIIVLVIAAIPLITYALSRLKPAAPEVELATLWPDTVKRGPMLREVRGLGTLVPEDIHWIPAQTAARVDKIVIRPGHLVQPDTVILEMSNPELQRDVLDAQYQLKAAEADYANLKVTIDSELMNQKANEAAVRSDFEQTHLQHDVDEKLYKEGIYSDHTKNLSKVREEQLAIRVKLESERTAVTLDSSKARLMAKQTRVDKQKALSKVKEDPLVICLKLESERTAVTLDSSKARSMAQQSRVDL